MPTYKCPFCDFTYVWTIEIPNTDLANAHTNGHENKPIIWSWIDLYPPPPPEPESEPEPEPLPEPVM